jgi:hypothetical protein
VLHFQSLDGADAEAIFGPGLLDQVSEHDATIAAFIELAFERASPDSPCLRFQVAVPLPPNA